MYRHLKVHYVIAIHVMRWLTNFYDFSFKWTATAAIGIHPTKARLSQLVNFKNVIWTWGHFRRTTWNKILAISDPRRPDRANPPTNFWWSLSFFHWHDPQAQRSPWTDSQQGIIWEFKKRFRRKRPALFKSGQWHFHQGNAPVHKSILVTDYLTKMRIKTVSHRPYSPDLAPCDFWLFPNLRGCRYETIEEMKEAVTKVIDTLTQEDFHGVFQKFLERYKCIAARGDDFEGD